MTTKILRNIISSTVVLASNLSANENTLYRVAYDIGSGKVKMQAALIEDTSLRIIKMVDTSEIFIPLRDSIDQSKDTFISEEMIHLLLSSMKQLQNKASLHGVISQSVGIGTEPFRVAKNGQAVLKRLEEETGIRLFCLSSEEEALLGVQTLHAEEKVSPGDEFISWENGGGSCQMTFTSKEGTQFFTKSLGKIPVKNYILHQIQGKDPKISQSPNPISNEEAKSTLSWLQEQLQDAPSWLQDNPSIQVVGMGAIFPNIQKTLGKPDITLQDLLKLLAERIGKTDKELKGSSDPTFMVSDLLFLYAVMEKLGIEKVKYEQLRGPGSTSGLLIDKVRWNFSIPF